MKSHVARLLLLPAVLFVFTACKPRQEAPAPPAPAAVPTALAPAAPSEPAPAETPAPAPADKVLSPTEAKDHVGKNATVRGKVFGVHITQKGDAFINVGAAFPKAPFVAVCFQGAIPAEELKALDGQTVSFTGKIKEHNGTIEIILEAADQISK